MKIEIGESLLSSWLKHKKKCQVVQINWKTSSSWILKNENEISQIVEEVEKLFFDKFNYSIFKNNSSLTQILRQAEIDVIGTKFDKEKITNIYAVEVAFHANGLNYGSKEETVSRIIKKLIRTALIIYGYFDLKEAHVVFASPKINNSIYIPLTESVAILNQHMNNKGYYFKFSVYSNEEFQENIFDPLVRISDSIADTSELFVRSIQLSNMFSSNIPVEKKFQEQSDKTSVKIGKLVRTTIEDLINRNLLSNDTIQLLLDKEYCKNTFNINYPLLKELNSSFSIKSQRYIGEYARYWSETFLINNNEYIVCQEWYERNREYFESWKSRLIKQMI